MWNRQKPLQPPTSSVQTTLQLCWKSLPAPQDLLSQASSLTSLVNGSSLLHGAPRGRGLALPSLHTVLESVNLPIEDGVSNGSSINN